MRKLLEELFPIYRTLCGPGATETLIRIAKFLSPTGTGLRTPLKRHKFPSGTKVFDWTIPPEFIVHEAWIKDRDGQTVLDFEDHPYHLRLYSQPYEGTVMREVLLDHLESVPDAVPLRQNYYKPGWGFCCSDELKNEIVTEYRYRAPYKVKIDVEHRQGYLRIGEAYLEGETKQEILINSYICHPLGANDNLSGVVAATEVFRRLAELPTRRYSYRLCLWPETIGPITWIANNLEIPLMQNRVFPWNPHHNIIAALTIGICGDENPLVVDGSLNWGPLDSAFGHLGLINRSYSGFTGPTDSRHFNGMGLNIPAVTLTRGGPCNFPEYHTSKDTLDIINWRNMEETVDISFRALQVLERNRVYRPTYFTTPCLHKHGIFPYQHGTGSGGKERTNEARAYFELMHLVDGDRDLLSIAESQGMSIFDFDEPVGKFLEAGLIRE